ncbi:MAG: ThuA domain-containing protein, partial [Planctomycetota bacterium]
DQFPLAPASTVTLNGAVTPLEGTTVVSAEWTQTAGPSATLVDPSSLTTNVTGLTPEAVFRFRLTAVDSDGGVSFDELLVSPIPGSVPAPTTSGELRVWHRVTLTFDGPASSETATPSPFRDYRLDVSFTQGNRSVLVPGFFAADGDAAESGANSGGQWRVHFMPDAEGPWSYVALLRAGTDVSLSSDPNAGTPVASVNGSSGTFTVDVSNASQPDVRSRGLLRYEGERYLRFAGDGSRFLKGGADSPENFLAYSGFDGTFDNNGSFLHDYLPHVADWQSGDPEWNGGAGHGIIGAINYLSSEAMNSIYFLTMNVGGDGDDVWPWTAPTERYRFDVSKLDQWEIVFSHMTTRGIMLHVITQETENDQLLDGGDLGPERRLYYRELIARFAHHPAMVWNLGEENTNTDAQRLAFAAEIRRLDPYDHPINVHTYPSQQTLVWTPLLGVPNFEVGSIQTSLATVHDKTASWVNQSETAGRPWAVCLDEIGPANVGVVPDATDFEHDDVRRLGLWGNLMAGGAGCEWYFGYGFPNDDLDCEDWRSRDNMWNLTRYALNFFQTHTEFWEMIPDDSLVSGDAWCLARSNDAYVVYLPSGGTTDLDLGSGMYSLDWFDPRNGGGLIPGATGIIGGGVAPVGPPPSEVNEDWVALLRREAATSPRVLVFSETAGFNHASQITAGNGLFTTLASQEGFEAVLTDDSSGLFVPSELATFDAVVFLNTTGNVLNASEEAAFEDYIANGGVYLGVHSATDTEYGWPFYGDLVGARFSNHPPGTSSATLDVVDATHPSTAPLP